MVLALGTSLPMIVGFFLVRPIPLPQQQGYDIVEDGENECDVPTSSLAHLNPSHLLDHDFVEPHHPHYVHRVDPAKPHVDGETHHQDRGVELTTQQGDSRTSVRARSLSRGVAMALDTLPNVYGKKLWRSGDFWLLFSILSLCRCAFLRSFPLVILIHHSFQ